MKIIIKIRPMVKIIGLFIVLKLKGKIFMILKKAVSLIIAVMIILTMIPHELSVSAAYETKVQIENATALGTKNNITIGDGYTITASDYWCMIHTVNSKRAVYCLEPGKNVVSGVKYNEDSANEYLKSVRNNELNSAGIQYLLGQVFLYGFTGTLDSAEAYNRYVASQILVWEVIVGQRDENFNRIDNGCTSTEKLLSNFKDAYAGKVISNYYYEYETLIKAHSKSISFAKGTKTAAERNVINAENDGTYTFKDSNNQLADFDAAVINGSVISKSENTLKIKVDDGKRAVVTLTQNNVKESGELTGFLTLTSDSNQTLAELKADPRKYYAAVKGSENGNLEIIKTSEDGIVADIAFTVSGNGNTYNVKTDKNGKISIPDLKAGEYSVTEVVSVRYEAQQTKKVMVQAGKTASVSFSNTLKKGVIKINKQSEDGENGGRTFEISGNGKTYTVNTNDDGVAILRDIPVYDSDNNKIVYTISEKNVPVKYVVPADQTATLTADETTTKTFKNILKKFTVEVTKQDAENGSEQGNASLAGAVYGIYQDGNLIDQYTTDLNGQFTTKEYLCGDNWTIQEIKPGEGYLLDETVYSVGAESKNYTIEKNTLEMTVYENIIKGRISIIKHSDNGDTQIETPEAYAEFEIYLKSAGSFENAKESERDVLICDENGFAQSKELPYGIYVVHQTVGWDGKEFISDFEVNISEHDKSYRYLFNNATMKSLVKIVKKDAETGNIIPASGIGFKIRDCSSGEFISQTINYPSQIIIDKFYTDETGSLMLPNELEYGNYQLHEIQTAEGYYLGTEVIPFSVDGAEEIITVEKFNTAQKGRIRVVKTGSAFNSVAIASSACTDEDGNVIENPTTYSPIFEETGLEGAVYQIIASEDIITADGTVRVNAGDIAAELITDKNGCAESELLYLGKYEIKEITAPYGYVLNSESQFAELTYAGQEIEVRDTVEAAFVNEYQGVEIILEKWLEADELFGIGGNLEYTNIRFGLFAEEEIIAADGTVIPQDGLISEVSLDEDFTAKFAEKIPFGRYYVQEISTDEHYILNGEKYIVSFEYMGQECTTVYLNSNDGNAIKNYIIRGNAEGKKVSETDKPLANAVFGLFPAGTNKFTIENAYMTAESDAAGCFSFAGIPYGKYIIKEIKAPAGYALSNEVFEAEITEAGETVEIKAVNRRIFGGVQVTKIDKDSPDNLLSGAEFTIYADEGCTNEIGKAEEFEKGIYMLKSLEFGKYFLKETAAPEGYVLDDNVYAFEIRTDGVIVEVTNTETGKGFVNTPITGSAEITKSDISDGSLIPDCGIEILDIDGNIIFQGRTDENGIVTFENLRYGNYSYREFDAPKGYLIDEKPYPFSIREDGEIVKCEMTNQRIPEKAKPPQNTPQTGDNHSNIPAIFMLLASAVILAYAIADKKMNRSRLE